MCDGARPQIMTDELRVRQIVMNGLTNAVKYSNAPVNGPIRVVVSVCDDAATGSGGGGGGSGSGSAQSGSVIIALAADAGAPPRGLLCFDVLDRGQGLGGLSDEALFVDFLAPVGLSTNHNTTAPQAGFHVGSSGVGLPICARYVAAQRAVMLCCSCVCAARVRACLLVRRYVRAGRARSQRIIA